MRKTGLLTTRLIHGNLTLRRSYTMPVRMKLMSLVQLILSITLSKATMALFFATAKLELVKLTPWQATLANLNIAVSSHALSIRSTTRQALNLTKLSPSESVTPKFTTRRFKICCWLIQSKSKDKTWVSRTTKEVECTLLDSPSKFVTRKRKHWIVSLKERWIELLELIVRMLSLLDHIQFTLFTLKVDLELNLQTRLFTRNCIWLILPEVREPRRLDPLERLCKRLN